jgi:glycerol-3-phosphate dehydrogenase
MLRRTVRTVLSARTAAYAGGTTVALTGAGYWYLNSGPVYPPSTLETRRPPPPWTPPSRKEMLDSLKSSMVDEFDLLVVGGGATGAGVALDAVTRGLKVAMVEREDFSSGRQYTSVFASTADA